MDEVRTLLQRASNQLAVAELASPRVDAELLLSHVLGVSRSRLLLNPAIDDRQRESYQALLTSRAKGTPLQHLTGSAPFRHLELAVGPGVFIPRPETELILDLAQSRLLSARQVVDLCAGSGALALAVAQEFPATEVAAVENSRAAQSWLQRNAETRSAAGDRSIERILADVADPATFAETGPLASHLGRVDVVVSNPPYVPVRIRDELSPEISFDPAEAVFAGLDGLALMPAIVEGAAKLLRADGLLVIEHDETQGTSLPSLLAKDGRWHDIEDHRDLTGRSRFTTAERNSGKMIG